ncbi:MAG: nuclear transport factor 2 family protein [Candidatus Marinimicrobia bacterium]|nr:nuclear transport factor 2 family protein [Candidatus Neomarinimicrobiota bacterium]
MRNPAIYLILLATLGLVACDQRADVAAEEAAIVAAIQNETNAFVNRDYDRLAAAWVHEPYVGHATIDSAGKVGWDSIGVAFKNAHELMNKEPEKYRIEFTHSNFEISLNGNAAFVIHNEHTEGIWAGEESSNDIKVVKHLIKKDGEWKLVAVF